MENNDKTHPTEAALAKGAKYGLFLICVIQIFNYADRSIIGVLMQPIKQDLHLSDTQIGLISGFAYALFYAVAGLVLAYLADKYSRKWVIFCSIVVWSAMTALTGAAQNFTHLFLARMGIGFGEAGAIPSSNSLIADWFPPKKRSFAMALFGSCVFIGIMAGSILGGLVSQAYGWRWAFVAAGAPGLVFALLALFTLKEPRRGESDGNTKIEKISLKESIKLLFTNSTYLALIASFAFQTFVVFSVVNWFPSYLARYHHMAQADIGLHFGISLGLGNAIGAIGGGYITNILVKRSIGWMTLFPTILSIFFFPAYQAAIFATNPDLAIMFIFISGIFGGSIMGPLLSSIQTVAPHHVRSTASGLQGLVMSIIGLGGGPFFVGAMSDYLSKTLPSPIALQHSMSIATYGTFVLVASMLIAHKLFVKNFGHIGK